MTTYVALLRGINVGGNNIIRMADLGECLGKAGFEGVRTYIQSGNVILTSSLSQKDLETRLEKALKKAFGYAGKVLCRTHHDIKKVLASMPKEWNTPDQLRCNIAYLREPLTGKQAAKVVAMREGVDSLQAGPGVLYMTTVKNNLSKSLFSKLAGQKIYQEMTVRNLNTTRKILVLMETEE